MKMSMLSLICTFLSCLLIAQNFSGNWRGNITRDYGNEIKTDSIEFHLEQAGNKLSGFSILYVKPGVYIKSRLTGTIQVSNNLLSITETKMEHTNMPDRGELIFLDKYILYYDIADTGTLTGKSVASQSRVVYSRSKMEVKKDD